LLLAASPPLRWQRELCATCPVPGIEMANACANLSLEAHLTRPFPFIKRQVQVTAFCKKTLRRGFDPHVGCGECHALPPVFEESA